MVRVPQLLSGKRVVKLRILTLIVLLMVTPDLSFAGIYRCENVGGKFVFTDNPANLPQGCQAEYMGDMPESNMTSSHLSPPDKVKSGRKPQEKIVDEGAPKRVEDEYEVLKGEAEGLVEKFLSTRASVYRALSSRSRSKARQALQEVRSEKGPMLSKVDKSTLSRSQKKNIQEILANITDD
ncbi:MAG: hypothetical protein RQ722_04065 [Desulfuromonadales bacterium]|nr:hypothetical protein [Desulfuromonadales bacterium]